MLVSLFVVALLFWLAVIDRARRSALQPILALLLTGKLACLLGALLVFAPRVLYPDHHVGSDPMLASGMADQQLAGLIMIAACPLSYVMIGVALSARLVGALASGGLSGPSFLASR
jgi:putative membrane protein